MFHLRCQNIFFLHDSILKPFFAVLQDWSSVCFIAVFFSKSTHWVCTLFLFMVHDLLEMRLQFLTQYSTAFNVSMVFYFAFPSFKLHQYVCLQDSAEITKQTLRECANSTAPFLSLTFLCVTLFLMVLRECLSHRQWCLHVAFQTRVNQVLMRGGWVHFHSQ